MIISKRYRHRAQSYTRRIIAVTCEEGAIVVQTEFGHSEQDPHTFRVELSCSELAQIMDATFLELDAEMAQLQTGESYIAGLVPGSAGARARSLDILAQHGASETLLDALAPFKAEQLAELLFFLGRLVAAAERTAHETHADK